MLPDMSGRTAPKKAPFMSATPDIDLLSDVLQGLRLRARIIKQGRYCGEWALDAAVASGIIFHLIGRGQAWVHREGQREPRTATREPRYIHCTNTGASSGASGPVTTL